MCVCLSSATHDSSSSSDRGMQIKLKDEISALMWAHHYSSIYLAFTCHTLYVLLLLLPALENRSRESHNGELLLLTLAELSRFSRSWSGRVDPIGRPALF